MGRRMFGWAGIALVAMLVAGCIPVPAGPADPNEVVGLELALHLVGKVKTPSGWRRIGSSPTSALHGPPTRPSTTNLIDVPELWEAPGPWSSVQAWLVAHPPAGMKASGSGWSGQSGVTTMRFLVYADPGNDLAEVLVSTAPGPAGTVVVRADAQVVWRPTRPSAEHASSALTSATIVVRADNDQAKVLAHGTVTDGATVQGLIAGFNGLLPTPPNSLESCVAFGLIMDIELTGGGAPPVWMSIDTACRTSAVLVGGKGMPELDPGSLPNQEATALGTTLAALYALVQP